MGTLSGGRPSRILAAVANERDIQIRLESEVLTGDELQIQRISGTDGLNTLFSYTIRASREIGAVIDPDELILQPASISFTVAGEEVHRLFGMITEVRDLAAPQMRHPGMELRFTPRSYSTTMRKTLDIFMEMSVPDIVEKCLKRCGLEAGEHYELALTESYDVKEFVVQYKESDFAFISRLCEHYGIFFFVDHSSGKDVLTFGDSNTAFPTLERTPEIPFHPIEMSGGAFVDRIGSVDIVSRALPKRYTVRDYNYRTPGVDLLASSDVDPNGLGEVVEYGAHFKGPNEGQRIADIRAQELHATKRIWNGLGVPPSICAGTKFMLTGHPMGDTELLVTRVDHNWGDGSTGSGTEFSTRFAAIMADVPFRPPRLTPKPRISGLLTGMVDAGVRDDYADIDDQGRYRVRFMYDTAERGEGQASRLVRMAQPHGGTGFGMHFPLRPNTEVTIGCVDGDPDRPIILGMVPNPETVSPVTSANRDRNVISTGGGNKIDISDEDGVQRIKMSTPHLGTVFQLGAPNAEEEGGIIQSSGNWVSQTADTWAAGSETWSAFNDLRSDTTGQNVTSVAGIPNPVNGFENFMKFYNAAKKTVQALDKMTDLALKTFDGKKEDEAERKRVAAEGKKTAEDAIINRRDPDPKYPDDAQTWTYTRPDGSTFETRETEAQFRARIMREELAAMRADPATAGEADAMSAAVDAASVPDELAGSYLSDDYANMKKGWAADVDAALGAAEKVADVVAKPLFSKVHKAAQKAIDKTAWTAAKAWAAYGQRAVVGAKARQSHSIRIPGTYYHLIAATDSAILNGYQGSYVMGRHSAFVGRQMAIVTGAKLHLDGGSFAELASRTVKVTSDTIFDLHSRGKLKIETKKDASITIHDKLKILTDDDTSMESKKKFFVKTKDLLDVDGGDEAKVKAKKWKFDSTDADVKVTVKGAWDAAVEGRILWEHNKKSRFYANGGEIIAQYKDGGKFYASSSEARLEKQSGGAKLTVNASSAKIDAKSKFDVKASSISLNGKCLFG